MASMLLKGGTILTHDSQDHVRAVRNDLLIEGNVIKKIANDIQVSPSTEVIDCKDKIISPGFVNTHLHTWETQLKGRVGDGLLLDYMVHGVLQGSQYTPKDVFWGQLAGCLEQIDNGTTTIAESVHITYSPDHAWNALSGTACSGVRSVFGYAPTARVKSWKPLEPATDMLADWIISTFIEIANGGPYAQSRVKISLNFDSLALPKEMWMPLFNAARENGVDYFMSHYVNTCILSPYFNPDSTVPAILEENGLLDENYLIIHATNLTEKDAEILRRTKAPISSCPQSEYHLAQSEPICFEDKWGLQKQASLGIDVHNVTSSYIPGEMRIALQFTRGKYNQRFIEKGKVPRRVNHTCEEAFNLGTIQGARAVAMGDKIGSLAEGKLADICIFNGTSPSMVCASEYDPVVAIVLHSSPADVEMVIVDGVIRKRNGKLAPVALDQQVRKIEGLPEQPMGWEEVAEELRKSAAAIREKIDDCGDLDIAKSVAMAVLGVNSDNVVDNV